MNDYGHVDDATPSFAISLYKDYRSFGIGTAMMNQMLELLKQNGYKQASLAVQKVNYAVKMYKNGQLYVQTTLDNEEVPYMKNVEVTEEDLVEINRIVELLEQRKKDKKNPIKRLVRFFKG